MPRGAHFAPEQPGDQEARDDEEHVHADEPTTHPGHVSVKEDNGHHRDGAQALDVRAKSRLRRAPTLRPSIGLTLSAWCKVTTYLGRWRESRNFTACSIDVPQLSTVGERAVGQRPHDRCQQPGVFERHVARVDVDQGVADDDRAAVGGAEQAR